MVLDGVMMVVLVIVWWCGGDVAQWRYGGFGMVICCGRGMAGVAEVMLW